MLIILIIFAYLEVFEVLWHHVCPHFIPFYNVTSVLGMPTGGARTGSLVISFISLFRGECQTP